MLWTGVMAPNAFRRSFVIPGIDEIERFAGSLYGRSLNIFPHAEDTAGQFHYEWQAFTARYGDALFGHEGVVTMFLWEVLSGTRNVRLDWDEYITRLNASGLQEMQALFGRYE